MQYRFFLTCVLCGAVAFPTLSSAAETTSKVRSVLGDVSRQKKSKNNWTPLRVGAKVFSSDRVRTGEESELVLALPEGSIVTISEHTEIELSELFEENGAFNTTIEIKSGHLAFSAQKQTNKKSSIGFKTGTATAAIRGTEGVISSEPFFAGLKNGLLEIRSNTTGQQTSVQAGQTLLADSSQFMVLELESSGDPNFVKHLTKILSDTTQSLDSIVSQIKQADQNFQTELKAAAQNISCSVESLPDTVFDTKVMLVGKCTGVTKATLHGEQVSFAEDGSFKTTISLDSAGYGAKNFNLYCSADTLDVLCGSFTTYYAMQPPPPPPVKIIPDEFSLNTESSVTVCDDGLQIAGSYRTLDSTATLLLTIGQKLTETIKVIADGEKHDFSKNISISDLNKLWNEKEASVSWKTKTQNETKKIALQIDKSCKKVNTIFPTLQFLSYDSLRCAANVSVGNVKDDAAVLTADADGSVYFTSQTISRNQPLRLNLQSGIHDYTFSLTDAADNIVSVQKTLGCFPNKPFSIDVWGNSVEKLRVPPPPYGMNDAIVKTLRFKVRLKENAPEYLHKVSVKQNGKEIFKEMTSQIQSLDFEIPLELRRNARNVFTIEVIHKSGKISVAKKIYEVR